MNVINPEIHVILTSKLHTVALLIIQFQHSGQGIVSMQGCNSIGHPIDSSHI